VSKQTVLVKFSKPRSRGYDILAGGGLLKDFGKELARRNGGVSPFVFSSPRVWRLHGKALKVSLEKAGFKPAFYLVPDGEQNKNFLQWSKALQALAAFGQGGAKKPLAVLFGGGVLGDLGGFAAASYKRGIPFVQVPTTLLAQVDSSVGGKLGIDYNTPRGVIKNLVGAFAQPEWVLADTQLLQTLPQRELRAGLAEAIKTAVLFDPKLFAFLQRNVPALLRPDPALLAKVVAACARHKARIVGRDEFDTRGARALLNLGHTFGHALESAAGLRWRHGEAVALGLCCACDLSKKLGLSKTGLPEVEALVRAAGLPYRVPGMDVKKVMAAMSEDKKFQGDLRFIVPLRLGLCRGVSVKDRAHVEAIVQERMASSAGRAHG
jgi:3-dehydroquinate synthase